jgi:Na+/H+ antiporter NhaA
VVAVVAVSAVLALKRPTRLLLLAVRGALVIPAALVARPVRAAVGWAEPAQTAQAVAAAVVVQLARRVALVARAVLVRSTQ